MRQIMTEEEAIAEFANRINPCFESEMTMRQIAEVCFDFFREIEVEDSADSMLLEWTVSPPEVFTDSRSAFVDNRNMAHKMEFAERKGLLMVALNRQFFIRNEDDDHKVHCTMYFHKPDDWDPDAFEYGTGFEFDQFSEAEDDFAGFLAAPFVSRLFDSCPDYMCASAEILG